MEILTHKHEGAGVFLLQQLHKDSEQPETLLGT